MLPPNNASEIDSSINLIKDKIEFYNNPSEEDKAAFREKSIKEWEERHAHKDRKQGGNYREKREDARDDREEEAPKKEKKEHQKKGKKAEIKEGDFPELA